ncbi:MAG: ribosomal-protein-alanine N-acetyltransferase [Nitrospiraceae bacterium]|nr:MAG: ribosomal-protein-alanine N-acetyltransferase [Nitrospiraceae bacterium]
MEGITVRKMLPADLAQVHALETLCYSSPWSMSSFRYELENRDAILLVALYGGRIIGYVCVRTILDMTHLLNVTASPEFRRQGIGSILLHDAFNELKKKKPGAKITLEVRQSNAAAISLYEKFGFRVTGNRKGYYQKPDDDALLMEMTLTG